MNSSDEPKIAIINSSFDSIFEGSETSSYLQVNGKKIRNCMECMFNENYECYQDSFEVLKQTNRQLKHEIRTQKEQLKCAIQKINEICHKYNFEEYLVNDEFDITDIKFS